jgi:hypothetical protein
MSFSTYLPSQGIRSKLSKNLRIVIKPNWRSKVLKSYFYELSNLPSSARVGEDSFVLLFYCMLLVRIGAGSLNDREKIENILKSIRIPRGFHEIMSYLPLGGMLYQFKSFQIEFSVDEDLVKSLIRKLEDGSLAFMINDLSRQLKSSRHASHESFNPSLLTSQGKHFNLSSFFCGKASLSEKPQSYLLNLSSRSSEITSGLALAIIFGFIEPIDEQASLNTNITVSDLSQIIGIVAEAELSDHDLDHATRLSFMYLLRSRTVKPNSDVGGGNSDQSDGDHSDVSAPRNEISSDSIISQSSSSFSNKLEYPFVVRTRKLKLDNKIYQKLIEIVYEINKNSVRTKL